MTFLFTRSELLRLPSGRHSCIDPTSRFCGGGVGGGGEKVEREHAINRKEEERRKWRHDSNETTEVRTLLLVDFVLGSQNKGFFRVSVYLQSALSDRPFRTWRRDVSWQNDTMVNIQKVVRKIRFPMIFHNEKHVYLHWIIHCWKA
jgi:hypothetical protein